MTKSNNTISKLGILISTAALALGFVSSASAQTTVEETSSVRTDESAFGLLGANYGQVAFRYTDLDSLTATAMRGAGVEFNQAWKPGIDMKLNYNWGRASAGPVRLTFQDIGVGATMFSKLDWGKPFVSANVGYEWRRGEPIYGNSFVYSIATGAELQLAPRWVLTPSIGFTRATATNRSEVDYALKATYRINRQWGVSVGAQYDSVYHKKDAKVYTVGLNYHY